MKKKLLVFLFIGFVFNLSALSVDPLRTKDAEAQKVWVDSIMNNMSIDEKIGQCGMLGIC